MKIDFVALGAAALLFCGLVAFGQMAEKPEAFPVEALTLPSTPIASMQSGPAPAMAPGPSFPMALLRCHAEMTLQPLPAELANHRKHYRRRSS